LGFLVPARVARVHPETCGRVLEETVLERDPP
jgi:hypothetical protein